MPKRYTTAEFIAKAREVHGDKYYYDKVNYVNSSTKVIITCPIHGDFEITPENHLHSKQGCNKCGIESRVAKSRLSKDEFVERANAVHHNFYNYDKVVYINSHSRVVITCPIHGDFKQLPYQHLNGHGCKKCATLSTKEKERISLEEFISRSKACHTIQYDYSKVDLNGLNSEVCIICPIHGEFKQLANTHLRGSDCPKCAYDMNARKRAKPLEKFIEDAIKVHGDKYDYSDTVYVTAKQKVAIRCKKHNIVFRQKPNAHLNGNGCPICVQSYLERDVLRLLQARGIRFQVEKTFDWLVSKGNLYLDYFLPDYGVAIECQGEQHFHACDYYGGESSFRVTKHRDALKKQLCEKHGIKILYYSNLGIKYPYDVLEDLGQLLLAIYDVKNANPLIWKDPELPLSFE